MSATKTVTKRLVKAVIGTALWRFRIGIMPRPRQKLLEERS